MLIYGPPGWRTYVAGAVLLAGVSAVLLTQIDLHRSVTAWGWLAPDKGLISIRPSRGGYIAAVHARAGEQVTRGTPLFEITYDTERSGGAPGQYYRLLDEERKAVRQRLTSLEDQQRLTDTRYAQRRRTLRDELEAADNALVLQQQRVEISRNTIASLRSGFDRGAVARLDIEQAEAGLLDEQREQTVLEQAGQRLAAELASLPSEHATERAALAGRLAALRQEAIALDQRHVQFTIGRTDAFSAPVSGRLSTLRAKAGDYADPLRSQATIVPDGSELQAELFLPSSALGYVEPGQPVRIRVEPFPHQKFGTLAGTVRSVSSVLEDRRDVPALAAAGGYVFRVIAELERASLSIADRSYPLQPDMRVDADVQLEQRTAWEWLLEPLLEAWRR